MADNKHWTRHVNILPCKSVIWLNMAPPWFSPAHTGMESLHWPPRHLSLGWPTRTRPAWQEKVAITISPVLSPTTEPWEIWGSEQSPPDNQNIKLQFSEFYNLNDKNCSFNYLWHDSFNLELVQLGIWRKLKQIVCLFRSFTTTYWPNNAKSQDARTLHYIKYVLCSLFQAEIVTIFIIL